MRAQGPGRPGGVGMRARIVTQPLTADEPISVDEAREHCEAPRIGDSVTDDADDAKFLRWIRAARAHAEEFTGLKFARVTLEVALDAFDADEPVIELPWYPVIEVTSFTYGTPGSSDSSDAYTLQLGTDFYLDTYTHPARIVPVSTWPQVTASTNIIRIQYTAGFGSAEDQDPVPPDALAAMYLTVGHLFGNRESTTEKAMSVLPLGIDDLLRPHRILLGMA